MSADDGLPDSGEIYRPALVRGRYRVVEVVHRGQRGDVVAAVDVREDRDVVLKRVFGADRSDTARLRTAHRVLSGLEHPNVVRTIELIETRSDLWLVSERVPGLELLDWWRTLPLGTNATFTERWAHAGPVVAALLDALEALHGRQLAHLDVKPANVVVTAAGAVQLVGIGLGKPPVEIDTRPMAEIRERAGFQAPELLDGLSISRRADQWSLGALAYSLLTGQRAVPGQTPAELAASYRSGRPAPVQDWAPDTVPDVAAVVMRMLAWDPEARFGTLAAVRAAFGPHLPAPVRAPLALWSAPRPRTVGLDPLETFLRRRVLELKAGLGSVVRVVDDADAGKTTLLDRWARLAGDDGSIDVHRATCLPGLPAAALDGWFRPPPVDPRGPPPTDLVEQALARFERPTVVLLDTLEEVDALAWARIQRAAGVAVRGGGRPLLLVLSGRALGGLDRWVPEDHPRLYNVAVPRLRPADVAVLIHAESGSEEDRQVAEVAAESYCADARGLPGAILRALLAEERGGRMRRTGAGWTPVLGALDLDAVAPAMPSALPQILGYVEELGPHVEVDALLAALPFSRPVALEALAWADQAGIVAYRRAGARWFVGVADRGGLEHAELHATQAAHTAVARWCERNGEQGGLVAERTARHWQRAGAAGRAADAYVRAARALAAVGASSEARRLAQLAQTLEARRTGTTAPGTNPLARVPR